MGCRDLRHGMENVMVTECAVGSENLLARATGSDGLKNAVQLLPQFFWFHIGCDQSVRLKLETAIVMPEHGRFPG